MGFRDEMCKEKGKDNAAAGAGAGAAANAAANALLHLGSHMEADQFALLVASAEGRAARARFAERRKP